MIFVRSKIQHVAVHRHVMMYAGNKAVNDSTFTTKVILLDSIFCRFTETDIKMGHLNSPGAKPAIFCFRRTKDKRSPFNCRALNIHNIRRHTGNL